MSFPRYPKYKASGVEWLGDVPEGWPLNRINHHFSERREKVSDLDFAALSVTKSGIVPQLDSAAKTDNGDNRKKVCAGDFVINSRSDRKGSAGVSSLDGSVSVISTVLSPRPSVHGPFIHHLLRSMPFQEEFYRFGKGIVADLWSTHYSEMRNIRLAIPPLPEQTAIAEFLDRETGKIDELVAEQRRLMELLKEKRQAVISHAVTKGLNPHAPMKPSGIEWLGDVPEHWQVGPVKRFFESCNTRRIPLSGEERGARSGIYPYYGASGIIDHIDEFIFDQDLVLVSEDGANLLNRASPIAFVARGKYWVNNHAHILRPLDSNLLFWAARIESIDITPFVTGSAQPKFTSEALGALIISAPPADGERTQIQNHIVGETAKFDTLTAEAQRAIDLLQERRTALISAAVTGQIDVRNPSPKN